MFRHRLVLLKADDFERDTGEAKFFFDLMQFLHHAVVDEAGIGEIEFDAVMSCLSESDEFTAEEDPVAEDGRVVGMNGHGVVGADFGVEVGPEERTNWDSVDQVDREF